MSHITLPEVQTSFAAKEAKDNFGRLLDAAQRRPITIHKKGRPVAVVMSIEEYELLEALDDAWWAERAKSVKKNFIGAKASEAYLRSVLHANG